MELKDYVFDKETIHQKAEVYQGEESITGKGTLACTSKRVVFVSGKDATDISIKNVTAMEYSAKRFPQSYLYTALGFLALAIVLVIAEEAIPAVPSGAGVGAAVISLVLIVSGLFLRRASLRVHTPGKTFNFTSRDDLDKMAHMVRAQESQ
jgi:hypothetical protein